MKIPQSWRYFIDEFTFQITIVLSSFFMKIDVVLQENIERVLKLMDDTIILTTKYINPGIWSKQVQGKVAKIFSISFFNFSE